ncbi:hypothetical protein JXO59_06120 [candidate division KSB1 bacterium]|nr:hypothetical protein [candidate division KSB1 bacterium]
MTLKEIIQNYRIFWYRSKARRTRLQISFAERLSAARDIIVCLPEAKNQFDAVIREMAKLQKIFPSAKVTLLYHQQNVIPTAFSDRFTLAEWNHRDANRYGAPTSDFMNKLFDSPCDLIIDLSQDFHFFYLCITQASNAPIKACFAHSRREDLYNLVFRPQPTQDLTKKMRSLLKYLSVGQKF